VIPTEVKVIIDAKEIEEYVRQVLQKHVNQQLLLVDINRMSDLTSMSVRYLEEEIISDPRVRVHERRKNRKRWWVAKPTFEAIIDIVDGW